MLLACRPATTIQEQGEDSRSLSGAQPSAPGAKHGACADLAIRA